MENILGKQIEEILKNSQVKDLKRSMEFFHRMQSVELPSESDRVWISEQSQIHLEALKLGLGKRQATKLFPHILFTMGRAYERYYVQKRDYNDKGV